MIVDSLDLGIRHCLVARKGVKMEDIRWVRSHEQVRSSQPAAAGPAVMVYESNLMRRRWANHPPSSTPIFPAPNV